jgi:hypothetical protein
MNAATCDTLARPYKIGARLFATKSYVSFHGSTVDDNVPVMLVGYQGIYKAGLHSFHFQISFHQEM